MLPNEEENYSSLSYSIKLFKNSHCVLHLTIWLLTHGLIYAINLHPLSNHAICVTWVHVVGDFCHITCLSQAVLWHPTLGASKNVKFRLSWNSTKFDVVARFCETIPIVKSVSLSEIKKNSGFLLKLPFFRKLEFSRILQFPNTIIRTTFRLNSIFISLQKNSLFGQPSDFFYFSCTHTYYSRVPRCI